MEMWFPHCLWPVKTTGKVISGAWDNWLMNITACLEQRWGKSLPSFHPSIFNEATSQVSSWLRRKECGEGRILKPNRRILVIILILHLRLVLWSARIHNSRSGNRKSSGYGSVSFTGFMKTDCFHNTVNYRCILISINGAQNKLSFHKTPSFIPSVNVHVSS